MGPLPFNGDPVFAVVFWAMMAVWILPEIVLSKAKRSSESLPSQDKGSFILVIILCFGGTLLGLYVSVHILSASISPHRLGISFAGIVVWASGVALRWYCIASLGRDFTFQVTVRPGQRLISTGPYRYIRHPSYLGALIAALGFGLALGNWASIVITLTLQSLGYGYRIYVEEKALRRVLGSSYSNYASRTRLLIPFLF